MCVQVCEEVRTQQGPEKSRAVRLSTSDHSLGLGKAQPRTLARTLETGKNSDKVGVLRSVQGETAAVLQEAMADLNVRPVG